MKHLYLLAALTVAFAPYEAFATPQSEYLPDIEDNLPYIEDDLPSTKHTLRGEARSLQLPDPAMVCGVNRVWICRGMFSDQCVINTSRLPNLLARTHSVLGKCACNLNRADIDCCQDFDCGDIAFRKCNMDSNQCFDLPCDAATQNGVGCCQDSECGNDAAFRICNMVSKQCENLPCNVTTQNNVDCCQDSDCGNLAFLECNLNSKKCVDLPCNATTQDGIDCCEDEDCISPGTCFDNTCVDEPRFCVPGVAGAECCEDTDCPGNFDCSSSNRCVQRNCNTGQQDIDCCSDSDCDTSAGAGESCSSNVCIVEGNPRATLIWNGDDELDLHFITPSGEHIYYGHQISSSGGKLDKDARGGTGTTKLKNENIHFPSPIMGESTVYVHNYDQFGTTNPDPWTLEIHLGDYVLTFSDTTAEGETSPEYKFRYGGP